MTISDKKLAVASTTDPNLIAYYNADVVTANDYYDGGMIMPGRKYQQGSYYRYGYQDQEIDNEIYEGAVAFKYRIEDPRIVRFLSLDPLEKKYPYNTPYAVQENKFGLGREFEGLEVFFGEMPPVVESVLKVGTETGIETSKPAIPMEIPIEQIVTSGNNLARPSIGSSLTRWAAYGREVHKLIQEKWREGEGFSTEETLGKFGRTDGIKEVGKNGFIRELKPNTSWGQRAGVKQLTRYLEGAKEKYPDVVNWKLELHLYGSASAVTSNALGTFYEVGQGESLSSISSKLNIKQSTLMTLNNLNNANDIKAGATLLVGVQLAKTAAQSTAAKKKEIQNILNFIKNMDKKKK